MKKALIDVPVYIIFFNRPDTLEKVFESVKEARPSKLFLVADGPRDERADDVQKIEECKKVVENIDWECEVHRNYSDVNLGCGKRMYTGISWAFEYVDRLIIIEDDCVLSQDFYPFCEELLERYKDDERIFKINAMNHLGVYDKTPNSYFFADGGCCGWATWRRAWKNVDYEMGFYEDKYSLNCLEKKYKHSASAIKACGIRLEAYKNGAKLSSWTNQMGISFRLQGQVAIVPKGNMITNIGLGNDSTHSVNSIKKLPNRLKKIFYAEPVKMDFPLKHPKYIIEDYDYIEAVEKTLGNSFIDRTSMRIGSLIKQIIYANKGDLKTMAKKIFKVGK